MKRCLTAGWVLFLAQVAVGDGDGKASRREGAGQGLGHSHGAMLAARAANADGERARAVVPVAGDEKCEQGRKRAQEFATGVIVKHIGGNLRLPAGKRLQSSNIKGVGQEADIEQQVKIGGGAMLKSEGDNLNAKGLGHGFLQAAGGGWAFGHVASAKIASISSLSEASMRRERFCGFFRNRESSARLLR